MKTISYKVISVFGCRKAEEELLAYPILCYDALPVQCKGFPGLKLGYENSKTGFLLSIPNNVEVQSLAFIYLFQTMSLA